MANDVYTSPLASRYASPYMLHLFSPDSRFQTWRRLWVALARAQHQLGLPITARQVQELEAHVTDIDYEVAAAREREVRHDVMAHVYAYGKAAPSAAGILHLGATSCYVTDNADLILYQEVCAISGVSCCRCWRIWPPSPGAMPPSPPWATPTISPPSR